MGGRRASGHPNPRSARSASVEPSRGMGTERITRHATDACGKLDEPAHAADAGFTEGARWAIALKVPPRGGPQPAASSVARVAATGVITPVAEFEP